MRCYFQLPSGQVVATDTPEVWASDPTNKRLSTAKGKALLADQSRASLLESLKPGDTVYTVLRHVSASGMSRRIDLFCFVDNEPRFLSGHAANVLSYKQHKDGGLIVGGCGMDMGFHLVYELSRVLFTDASKDAKSPAERRDAGYALNHRWL